MKDSFLPAEMSGENEVFEPVLLPRAVADIVDDEGEPFRIFLIRDDHDVREVRRHGAGNDVAGEETFVHWKTGVLSFEKRHEVRDAAVVDVLIRTLESPVLRIASEISFHVLMDESLKILSEAIAKRTDDDVGADSSFSRHIAVGVFE